MPKPSPAAEMMPAPAAGRGGALASPLAGSPAFLVRLAQLRAFDEFHRQFANFGVTPAGFSVFALVIANPGLRPGAIAEELRVKPSNVAVLVNGLVAAGLVRREPDPAELRASLLHPTRAGQTLWQDMEQTQRETDARFTEALTPEERGQFVALLRKLLHR
ncbi:MarR family winged helix-turn-helix transcriptional regulator [Belnapia rosea]|uniref:MarR family winged helix-turn-helix transcriptional regulator n=1 Tax=Belnapia rosea TaxID=938405 RepID=UPI0008899FF1|nr:MarR family transcriptional regulator [Belnapia rosea]SDB57197.1 DNA-binding transcriptional regulator, MarR family [Belnapia rosea]